MRGLRGHVSTVACTHILFLEKVERHVDQTSTPLAQTLLDVRQGHLLVCAGASAACSPLFVAQDSLATWPVLTPRAMKNSSYCFQFRT